MTPSRARLPTLYKSFAEPFCVHSRDFPVCSSRGFGSSGGPSGVLTGVVNSIFAVLVFPYMPTSVAQSVRRSGAFVCLAAHVWHFDVFLLSVADAGTIGVRRRDWVLLGNRPLPPQLPF